MSSNTAFADLTHRVTTSNVVNMAAAYGVNVASAGLLQSDGQADTAVPFVAIGESSLTVNEQAQMIATIDDNGMFHTAHMVKSWQLPDQAVQTPVVTTRQVLTPALDSQVQYAMEGTTVYGTATDASVGLGNRPIIGKTGTTTGFLSAFFLGAIPQYAVAIGMFTPSPTYKVNGVLASIIQLGGGGVGGYWPAKIWNTFAQAEFANLPVDSFQNPVFTGSTWNMIGPLPKAKQTKKPAPKCSVMIHGRSFPVPGKGCPSVTPTPTPSNTGPGGFQSPTATPSPSISISGLPTGTASATPSSTSTQQGGGGGQGGGNTANTASGVKAGMAVGGLLAVLLPGSLLWTTSSRRRRRRGAAGSR
jgi:membrane peptidoglycan carboxypeptidase